MGMKAKRTRLTGCKMFENTQDCVMGSNVWGEALRDPYSKRACSRVRKGGGGWFTISLGALVVKQDASKKKGMDCSKHTELLQREDAARC